MRKVIIGAFVSLDGVMQAPGGPEEDPTGGFKFGGWVVPHTDEVFGQAVDKMFGQPFDLLLGRKTYEIFAARIGHMLRAATTILSLSCSTALRSTSRRARPWT
jgi:dihydrofolate reductase